jgi:hypothetical protein
MTVFVSRHGDVIEIKARAIGDGIIGDMTHRVRPGQTAMGKTYEEWSKLSPGEHNL